MVLKHILAFSIVFQVTAAVIGRSPALPRIEDTGEGITPENMNKLFQPLFTTNTRGIGLGLVVCKSLTEANGRRIEALSDPERGTRFSILLPVGG